MGSIKAQTESDEILPWVRVRCVWPKAQATLHRPPPPTETPPRSLPSCMATNDPKNRLIIQGNPPVRSATTGYKGPSGPVAVSTKIPNPTALIVVHGTRPRTRILSSLEEVRRAYRNFKRKQTTPLTTTNTPPARVTYKTKFRSTMAGIVGRSTLKLPIFLRAAAAGPTSSSLVAATYMLPFSANMTDVGWYLPPATGIFSRRRKEPTRKARKRTKRFQANATNKKEMRQMSGVLVGWSAQPVP